MIRSLSNLSTNPNGEGSQETVVGPSQTPGTAAPTATKREKSSPGETSAPKRPRTGPEGGAPGQHSFTEAASKALFLSIVPLDSEGNEIGATASDRKFIVEKLEEYIAKSGPKSILWDVPSGGGSFEYSASTKRHWRVSRGWPVP